MITDIVHPLLRETVEVGYVHIQDIPVCTVDFACSLGDIFEAHPGDDPIVPLKIEGDDATVTSYASCRCAELSLHTDYATFPVPPRFTITHCLAPDPEFPRKGRSIIVLLDEVLGRLSRDDPHLDHLLRTSLIPFRRNNEHDRFHSDLPQFTILEADDSIRFDRTLIFPVLEASALEEDRVLLDGVMHFEEMCHNYGVRAEIALDKGSALIMDNRKTLHSRSQCSVLVQGDKLISREVNLTFLE